MPLLAFESELWLPRPPEALFPFFSDALNLEVLTPPFLHFRVLSPAPIEMRVGTRIDYRLRIHGIPLRWQSEITAWDPPHRFADEQSRGPYRTWIHTHRFAPKEGGTLITDQVAYAVFGGAPINRLFVRPDLERIFAYRTRQLVAKFG